MASVSASYRSTENVGNSFLKAWRMFPMSCGTGSCGKPQSLKYKFRGIDSHPAIAGEGECAERDRHARRLAGVGIENGSEMRRGIDRCRVGPERFHLQPLTQIRYESGCSPVFAYAVKFVFDERRAVTDCPHTDAPQVAPF